MRLSSDQILSDEKVMTDFICERIPSECRVILTAGEDGETWADLWPYWDDATGWHLLMEKSDEHVTLEEVYDHFRRKEMTHAEFWRVFEWSLARSKVVELEEVVRRLRATKPKACHTQEDYGDLPREVSTADAARILGVTKDTVLKYKDAGMLEYRNMAPPSSSRPVFAFSLASVLKLRTTYGTDEPPPFRRREPTRRAVKGQRKRKHIIVER
jgi:hypothetical protein